MGTRPSIPAISSGAGLCRSGYYHDFQKYTGGKFPNVGLSKIAPTEERCETTLKTLKFPLKTLVLDRGCQHTSTRLWNSKPLIIGGG